MKRFLFAVLNASATIAGLLAFLSPDTPAPQAIVVLSLTVSTSILLTLVENMHSDGYL